jgi:hypothetical protein
LKRANSPQDESAVADLRRKWSTIPKQQYFHNQPSRLTAWRLFVSPALNSPLFELACVPARFDHAPEKK